MTNENADYPYANTMATRMLSDAIEKSGKLQREIARDIGYKSSVMLSHMASGRVAIPYEKRTALLKTLDLSPRQFTFALIYQRDPEMAEIIENAVTLNNVEVKGHQFVEDLETIFGGSLSKLTPSQLGVIREVVADRKAERRWLSLHELPAVEAIRAARPEFSRDGLNERERRALKKALSG